VTLAYTYDGAALTHNVAPSGIEIPQRADMGEVSMGGIPIEDPAADLTMLGHRPFTVTESACAQPRLFTGWTAERGIGRDLDLGLFVGPNPRIHDATILDLNALFGFRLISGADAKRPEETWEARLEWILHSDYLTGLISTSRTFTDTWPNPMDEADYTGSYPSSVLDDLAQRFDGAVNYFAFWDPAGAAVTLFMDHVAQGIADCTLSISNLIADVNSTTCFAPDSIARLQREPDQTYSEVIVEYANGKVFRTAPATATKYIRRGTTISRPYTGKKATAEAQGDQFLAAHSEEVDRITCSIRVPAASVGLVRAGQRISVRFSHMPGYETATWMRIVGCSPKPTDDLARYYDVALEMVGRLLLADGLGDVGRHRERGLPASWDRGTGGSDAGLCRRLALPAVRGGRLRDGRLHGRLRWERDPLPRHRPRDDDDQDSGLRWPHPSPRRRAHARRDCERRRRGDPRLARPDPPLR
jgi:hypothetical protein